MDLEQTSNQSKIFDSSEPKTSDRSSIPNKPVAAPYTTEGDTPDEDSICHECRQVDWDNLPILVEQLEEGMTSDYRTIRTIGANHEQVATSPCKICRILSVVMPRSPHETGCVVAARSLSHFSAYALPRSWTSMGRITALHVCPRVWIDSELYIGYSTCVLAIRRDGEDSCSRMISPRSIDYDWLKHLARSCEESHKGCRRRDSLSPVSVSGLKVIEVSSRTIIGAPAECRYVALSYVWGKQTDVGQTLCLQCPPPLIEDAISVTIAMGYEYLWIDRYANDQERHHMISQMDQVYANASLTIIDASGGDAQSGLPGVSVPRLPKFVHIRNTAILELSCGEHELNSSKWATRGWTYQEGYFSTRRLVFTPTQVLFHCNENYQEESVCRLLQQDIPEYSCSPARFRHLSPDFSSNALISSSLMTQLGEYSKRELTYPRDSLNAFLGVLNFHTHESRSLASQILHISWGLVARKMRETGNIRVWLNWYHEAPAERRPEFPSWAWTGWGGPLSFEDQGITLHKRGKDSRPLPHLEWEISWESKDHKAMSIWEFAEDSLSTSYTDNLQLHQQTIYPNRLKVTCLVVPTRFQVVSLTEAQKNQETEIQLERETGTMRVDAVGLPKGNVAVVQFCQGIYIAAPTYLDQGLDMQDGAVIGLLFAGDCDSWSVTSGCLLARQLDEGVYERVGAIPYLMAYPRDGYDYSDIYVPQSIGLIFLDQAGSVLDKVTVPARQRELPFDGVGERRSIVLV